MASLWPFRRSTAEGKKAQTQQPSELRIATSGSFSIRATIECLRVDGAGSYAQPGRVRAALFVPSTVTTVQFHGDGQKKPGANARSSCVHVLQMFTAAETANILDDAKRIGTAIGWSDRGVSLPTQDVLVQNLPKESQEMVHKAIREQLLPFARRQYPHLNAAFDKQPYPRPGNLFIVRYSAASQRPGGRGLKMHKDETALTFNMCLSPQDGFEGGGTYFPAASGDVDGILLRPTPGYCLVHDGNIKHAGNDVVSGDRYILVGFYNADGRDRAGEDAFFNKKALEDARQKLLRSPPVPTQTIYFTTAVAATRGGPSPVTSTNALLPAVAPFGPGEQHPPPPEVLTMPPVGSGSRNLSSVAIQGPIQPIPGPSSSAMAAGASSSSSSVEYDVCRSSSSSKRDHGGGGYVDHHRLDTLPMASSLPPLRPGSPTRPATPTDSQTGLLTPGSLSTPGRGSPVNSAGAGPSSAPNDGMYAPVVGTYAEGGRLPPVAGSSNSSGSDADGPHGRGRDGSGGHGDGRMRSRSPRPHGDGGGGTLHHLDGSPTGGRSGYGTSTCMPNWPVLNLLLHSKLRPLNKMGR